MRIADQAGWLILNDRPIRARWSGSTGPNAVEIEHTGDPPYSAVTHFGEGILTFLLPYLFRTSHGTSLLFRGPVNLPKDLIAPLEALVETDWAVAAASMNWKFTRPNSWIEFARGEPVCMIVPQRLDLLENAQPRILDIEKHPQLNQYFQIWSANCRTFNERLRNREAEAIKQGWQQYYLRGSAPHASGEVIAGPKQHRTRLLLRNFDKDQRLR